MYTSVNGQHAAVLAPLPPRPIDACVAAPLGVPWSLMEGPKGLRTSAASYRRHQTARQDSY